VKGILQFTFTSIIITGSLFPCKDAGAITATVTGSLPSRLSECSGLDYGLNNTFWTHNDGYGDNRIYKISSNGALLRTLYISGATNYDWEDITHNASRTYLYIGDFGNNNSSRQNLRIYRIPHPNNYSSSSVSSSRIYFSYPDQTQFPSPWQNFDVEAFFHDDGKLFLFTKGYGGATAYTKMYSVPDAPGTYVATLCDSFYVSSKVTSADLSPDRKTMILLTNNRMHVFRNFSGTDYFGGQYLQLGIAGYSTQKEGIAFSSNNCVYMTEEGSANKIYTSDLSPYITSAIKLSEEQVQNEEAPAITLYPNPADHEFSIEAGDNPYTVNIFDLTGKHFISESHAGGGVKKTIDTSAFPAGIYFCRLMSEGREVETIRFSVLH
jgi:hypothetical protein